jgi:hypothetical protein
LWGPGGLLAADQRGPIEPRWEGAENRPGVLRYSYATGLGGKGLRLVRDEVGSRRIRDEVEPSQVRDELRN